MDASPEDQMLYNRLLDFDWVYKNWLYYFDGKSVNERLSEPVQMLVELMFNQAGFDLSQNTPLNFRRVWEYYERARSQVKQSEFWSEKADVDVACARVEYHFGRLSESAERLNSAIQHYLPFGNHYSSVCHWLEGIVFWFSASPEIHWSALPQWRECFDGFESFATDAALPVGRNKWYLDRCAEINRFFKQIKKEELKAVSAGARPGIGRGFYDQPGAQLQPGAPPPGVPTEPAGQQPDISKNPPQAPLQSPSTKRPVTSPGSVPETSSTVQSSIQPPVESNPLAEKIPEKSRSTPPPGSGQQPRSQSSIFGYPLLGEAISAGKFKEMRRASPEEFEYVNIDQVNIHGVPYDVVSLRGGNVVNYTNARSAYVLRVEGDSMDAYPILPGDYVMILPTSEANPGDVVYTEIIKPQEDIPEGNLKYLRSNDRGEITLSYRSTKYKDERGEDRKFVLTPEENQTPVIKGIAIARFTPKSTSKE